MHASKTLARIAIRSRRIAIILSLAGLIAYGQQPVRDLDQMSPEELAKVEVTSVSKKEQKLSDTAAAIYVITQQDIRNSTATTIPELLRSVPGLDVAQIGGGNWAISARGFAEQYAGKMLVLVDGRSVFDAAFSGAVWPELNMPLSEIERIEVIRGPGAVMWGTNAVNGVINIITRHSKDTQGGEVSAGTGDPNRSYSNARYGGHLGKSSTYRLFTQYFDDGPLGTYLGQPAHDSARSLDGGLRFDSRLNDRDALLVEGQIFNTAQGMDTTIFSYSPPYLPSAVSPLDYQGGYALARVSRRGLSGSQTELQLSYQHTTEGQLGFAMSGNVGSATLQHETPWGSRQDLVMGLEYDFRAAETKSTIPMFWFNQPNQSYYLASGFLQDEILFLNGNVRLTLGGRIEENRYSGVSFNPNARVLWKISPSHSVWLAYSRANRSVSPVDHDLVSNPAAFDTPDGLVVERTLPNPNLKPENIQAFEAGYRFQVSKNLFFDAAAFFNRYGDLVVYDAGQPFFEAGPPPRIVQPLPEGNDAWGRTAGAELSAKWTPSKWTNFGIAYSLNNIDLDAASLAGAANAQVIEGQVARHQVVLTSSINLTHKFVLDSLLEAVDRRTYGPVPGYGRLDSSLAWRPRSWEFRAGANNLLNKQHLEFVSNSGAMPTFLGRAAYGRATWHFGGR